MKSNTHAEQATERSRDKYETKSKTQAQAQAQAQCEADQTESGPRRSNAMLTGQREEKWRGGETEEGAQTWSEVFAVWLLLEEDTTLGVLPLIMA